MNNLFVHVLFVHVHVLCKYNFNEHGFIYALPWIWINNDNDNRFLNVVMYIPVKKIEHFLKDNPLFHHIYYMLLLSCLVVSPLVSAVMLMAQLIFPNSTKSCCSERHKSHLKQELLIWENIIYHVFNSNTKATIDSMHTLVYVHTCILLFTV